MGNEAKEFVKNRTMVKQIKNLLDEDLEDETEAKPMHIKKNNFIGKPGPELAKLAKAFKEAKAAEESETPPDEGDGGLVSFSSLPNFSFLGMKVRIYTPKDKEYRFCAVDVCKILGYINAEQTLKTHCLGEPIKHRPDGATKPILYISEGDLYNLILRCSKPNAELFRRWVTEEVLPSLRRDGKYFVRKLDTEGLPPAKIEPLPAQGEQLEMFPQLVKLSLKAKPALYKMLANCRSHLKDKGTTFPTHEDYIGYLLKKGLESIGFEAGEEI